MALLKTKQLIKIYSSGYEGIKALGGVDIEFNKNEFIAILGPSGCGKSTFLNVISGLEVPSSGEIIIQGQSTKGFNKLGWDLFRRHNLGMIFQHFNLINHYTALENVALPLTLAGVSVKERNKKALAALEKVGLKDKINNSPLELSGGEKQRVAIARALINDPDIILADEPTGSLDSATGEEIMNILKELAKDKLLIMVTHNLEYANKYATRILTMEDGLFIQDEIVKPVEPSSNNRLKISSKGLKYKDGINLVKKGIQKRLGRLISTIIAASIGVSGIALIIGLGQGANRFSEEQMNMHLKANIVDVRFAQKRVGSGYNYSAPSNAQLDKLVAEIGRDKLTYRYNLTSLFAKTSRFDFRFNQHTNSHFNSDILNFISDYEYIKHYEKHLLASSQLPKANELEVIVNTSFLDTLNDNINAKQDYDYYLNKSLNLSFSFKQLDNLDNNLYEIIFNKNLIIVGIIKEIDLFSSPSVYMYQSTFINEINKIRPLTIEDLTNPNSTNALVIKEKQLEILDTENLLSTLSRINNSKLLDNAQKEYLIISDLSLTFKRMIGDVIGMVLFVLSLFMITALIVAMFMISILLYTSVIEKKLELGILKALGSTNQDVKRYVLSEALIVGFFTSIFALVLSLIIELIVYLVSPSLLGTNYRFLLIDIPIFSGISYSGNFILRYTPFIVPLLLFIISIVTSYLSGLIPARKATKLTIVDILREE